MLSAYQARQMMPNKKVTKLVEYILSGVPERAKKGQYDLTIGCPKNPYSEQDIELVEETLKKLGYNIKYGYTDYDVWFFVNWRE